MENDKIKALAAEIMPRVREFRRHIHSYPELSFAEHRTAEYISGILSSEGIAHRRVAGTGLLARITGEGDPEKAVVLRADIDALPVTEQNDCSFASRNEGVMHACGHDMHAAVLLGATILLYRNRHEIKGTVFCLFQPGEELCPGGASLVLAENPFNGFDIKAFIGEHVDPDLPTGVFGMKPGQYMASSDEVRITINGKGGHGGMPQKLKDPVLAASAVVMALQQVVSRNCDPDIPTVISVGKFIADGATNVIPDSVYLEGTLRTFDEPWRAEAKKRITEVAESTASAYGVEADVRIRDGFPCVVNTEGLVDKAHQVLKGVFGPESTVSLGVRPTAEDFGFYSQLYPSLFYRFGVGGTDDCHVAGSLHTSTFNPDEKSLEYAVVGMLALAFDFAGK